MAAHPLGSAATLLNNGEMKRFELEGKGVVLARVEGEYYAFRAACTHYGGPMDEGVLKGYTVMCPWHHACFDIRTGERLEPPALNDLPCYETRIENGNVVVNLDQTIAAPQHEPSVDNRHFIIVGGGAAGEMAAEELRRQRFSGKITIVSAVSLLPIDRPNVSKDYLSGDAKAEWMPLRQPKWYADRDIEVRLNTRVSRIDPNAKTIQLENGENLRYDKLLLATGGKPRTLNIEGADLANIFTLREQADADRIIQVEGKRAVIIGSSFIGMEAAYSLTKRGVQVTVVGLEAVPFEPILGVEVGGVFQAEHEANKVQFRLSSSLERYIGSEGRVTGVQITGGEILDADFVVLGVGVAPATDFLTESGLALNERDRAVMVNTHLQSSLPDIYAAGDIARWESESGTTRIEHWRLAQQQGMVAARNMLGQQEDFNQRVPFFWTKQWGISLRYVGHAQKWDEILYRGDVAGKNFIAFYVAEGKLLAAAGCKRDAELNALEFILKDNLPLTPEQMQNPDFDLIAYSHR